jgi:hypothetical protein
MVPRTEGYAYAVGVWDLSTVSTAIFCRAVPNPDVTIRHFLTLAVGDAPRRRAAAREQAEAKSARRRYAGRASGGQYERPGVRGKRVN